MLSTLLLIPTHSFSAAPLDNGHWGVVVFVFLTVCSEVFVTFLLLAGMAAGSGVLRFLSAGLGYSTLAGELLEEDMAADGCHVG